MIKSMEDQLSEALAEFRDAGWGLAGSSDGARTYTAKRRLPDGHLMVVVHMSGPKGPWVEGGSYPGSAYAVYPSPRAAVEALSQWTSAT
jgi:hypothetical protein